MEPAAGRLSAVSGQWARGAVPVADIHNGTLTLTGRAERFESRTSGVPSLVWRVHGGAAFSEELRELTVLAGIPFLSVSWRDPKWSARASLFGPTNVSAEADRAFAGPVRAFDRRFKRARDAFRSGPETRYGPAWLLRLRASLRF